MSDDNKPRAKRVDYQSGGLYGYRINCPGCRHAHVLPVGDAGDNAGRDRWTFNGDIMKPTFSPSLLVNKDLNSGGPRCHSFITDGRINYLDDCTHALRGLHDLPPASPMFFDDLGEGQDPKS